MGLISKLNNLRDCYGSSRIYDIYYNLDIDERIAYLESRNGNDFTGNIFRIAEELSNDEFGDLKIYVYANEEIKSKIADFKKNYNLKIHKVITDENEACEILQKAKYIFTDSGIRPKFVKRDGQIMINTWHGTPLKLMGFDYPDEQPNIGIIQKSLLYSDYLLYPNEYMMEIMLKAYMIGSIYPGEILLNGYPRNSVFSDSNKRAEFRKRLDFDDKEVYVYMPTFKGFVSNREDEKQKDDVDKFLEKIDVHLKGNQIFLVKFHPYNQAKIDFSKFNNIFPFPEGYENYDILNASDCLITDYSSVFFDFANTGRKIIIFNYDEEDYLKNRGIYFPLDELPFPKAGNVGELIDQLNLDKDYDDEEFLNNFCEFDSINSASTICRTVINDEKLCNHRKINNTNDNILVYAAGIDDNDSTKSLIGYLESIDKTQNNVFVSFKRWHPNIKENHVQAFKKIPEGIKFLPLSYPIDPTIDEKLNLNKFLKDRDNQQLYESLKPLFERSFKKQYGNIRFDLIIDYDTSDIVESLIFANSGHKNRMYFSDKSNKDIYNKFDEAYEIGEIK